MHSNLHDNLNSLVGYVAIEIASLVSMTLCNNQG